MVISLPPNHFSLAAANDLSPLFSPLTNLGLQDFTYIKSYPNARVHLSTSAQLIEEYYSLQFYNSSFLGHNLNAYQDCSILWPITESKVPLFENARNRHGIKSMFMIIKNHIDYCEFYLFSSTLNQEQLNNLVLNSVEIFYQFIAYFKDRAAKLINKSENYKILIEPNNYLNIPSEIETKLITIDELAKIKTSAKNELQLKNHWLKLSANTNIKLTKRELECIVAMMSGLNYEQIAKKLHLSRRTVESYMENIKLKLSCHNRLEIISKLLTVDAKFFLSIL